MKHSSVYNKCMHRYLYYPVDCVFSNPINITQRSGSEWDGFSSPADCKHTVKLEKAQGALIVSILYICISSLTFTFYKTEVQDNFFNLWAIRSKWRRSFTKMRKFSNYQWHSSLKPPKHGFPETLQSMWKCNYWFYFYGNTVGQELSKPKTWKGFRNQFVFEPLIFTNDTPMISWTHPRSCR